MLQDLPAHVQRQIFGINDPSDKTQPRRHQLLVVIGDEDPLDIELYAGFVVHMVQVERRFLGDVKKSDLLQSSFGLGMHIKKRILPVVSKLLIEFGVVLFFEF